MYNIVKNNKLSCSFKIILKLLNTEIYSSLSYLLEKILCPIALINHKRLILNSSKFLCKFLRDLVHVRLDLDDRESRRIMRVRVIYRRQV